MHGASAWLCIMWVPQHQMLLRPAALEGPTTPAPVPTRSFNKMVWCDGADGLVRIPTVDKVTCLQAVPGGDAGAGEGLLSSWAHMI